MFFERIFLFLTVTGLLIILVWAVLNLLDGYQMIKTIFPQVNFGAFLKP